MVSRVAHYNRKALPVQLNDGVDGEVIVDCRIDTPFLSDYRAKIDERNGVMEHWSDGV